MAYLTELANPKDMLTDTLLTDQKDLRWKFAFANNLVDLFDKLTWVTEDYEPLLGLVHEKIAPQAVHQQRCENHVQSAALTASTRVEEGRLSDRAPVLSYLIQG